MGDGYYQEPTFTSQIWHLFNELGIFIHMLFLETGYDQIGQMLSIELLTSQCKYLCFLKKTFFHIHV